MDEPPSNNSYDSCVFPKAEQSRILVPEGPVVNLKAGCSLFQFRFVF